MNMFIAFKKRESLFVSEVKNYEEISSQLLSSDFLMVEVMAKEGNFFLSKEEISYCHFIYASED